jgi:Ca2+/Na+ antiporter
MWLPDFLPSPISLSCSFLFFFWDKSLKIYLCIYVFIYVCMYLFIYHAQCSACKYACTPEEGAKITLQMVVNHHVVAGNRTKDLWKRSQCSQLLSHLSSPRQVLLLQPWMACNSLCRPGQPWISIDPPASASKVPALKAWATMSGCKLISCVYCLPHKNKAPWGWHVWKFCSDFQSPVVECLVHGRQPVNTG